MHTITTRIDIAASPAKVRAAFLDFSTYPTWSQTFVKSITVTSYSATSPAGLKPGDTIKVVLSGATFSPTVTANTPDEFKWRGSMLGLFVGEHAFKFQPSESVEGHTTLVQEEAFSGMFAFLVGENSSGGRKTKANFEAFNQELKARAEAS